MNPLLTLALLFILSSTVFGQPRGTDLLGGPLWPINLRADQAKARKAHIYGTIFCMAEIDTNGKPHDVHIIQSTIPLFDHATIDSFEATPFRVFRNAGRAVTYQAYETFVFGPDSGVPYTTLGLESYIGKDARDIESQLAKFGEPIRNVHLDTLYSTYEGEGSYTKDGRISPNVIYVTSVKGEVIGLSIHYLPTGDEDIDEIKSKLFPGKGSFQHAISDEVGYRMVRHIDPAHGMFQVDYYGWRDDVNR